GPGAGDAVGDPALAALRGLHLRVAADVTEERHQRFGAEHPEVILARQGSGFRRVARLDTATAGVLSASDGELSVGQLVGAVAALLELDEAGRAGLLAALRELYEDGFLVEG
ncbi:methyltransferase, partial [Micrococcus luteus]|nr:methyltransferase [Micrococcus luteus]